MQIQNSVSVAANTTIDNVISGSQWEYLPWNASLAFGLVASATGLEVDVYTGGSAICERLAPSLANRFPIDPDDYTLRDIAAAGERMKIRVTNTTAGALTFFYAVQIYPV